MAIHLKISNSLQSLANQLAEELRDYQDPFLPIYVVTQTEGMNNWLKQQIAEKNGIMANIAFLRPNDIVFKVFQTLEGSFEPTIDSRGLSWVLFELLNRNDFKTKFPEIAAYYENEDETPDLKRLALAEKIGDLFDQYQVYRTELIDCWDRGDFFYKNEKRNDLKRNEDWQQWLWRQAKSLMGNNFRNKNYIGNYVVESLKKAETDIKTLTKQLPKVYFFGLSLITKYHLQIMEAIGKKIEVVMMLQNPAPNDYWFDDMSEKMVTALKARGRLAESFEASGNPLLVSWGSVLRSTFRMLFENDANINGMEEIGLMPPETDSLLHQIQQSIFANQKEEIVFTADQLEDGSLTINSCFSPAREVEVLYNYLIHLIDKEERDLSARDIVVMVTDIDTYAPYINAVFGNPVNIQKNQSGSSGFGQREARFPFTIADESFVQTNGLSGTLSELLTLTEKQFTAQRVFDLLNFPLIRKHFRIKNPDLIRESLDAANIRFGINGTREEDTVYISWDYGLKRIMYGLCMSGEQEVGLGEASFYPLDLAEGFDMETLTRFVYFVQQLIKYLKNRKNARSLADWISFVQTLITTFIGEPGDIENEDYILFVQKLGSYNLLNKFYNQEIDFELFLYNFQPLLQEVSRANWFAGKGITFCSLIPMRSIPFKVVAVLGLNYDKFPRIDKKLSFNLMTLDRQMGDRNLKENDKHLFLETLLSAKENLYLSFIGQNVKDNSILPPSSLVDELLDFIFQRSDNPNASPETWVQRHPLHSFSRKYNTTNAKLYSYSIEPKEKEWKQNKGEETEKLDFNYLDLDQIRAFFRAPVKFYFNKRLHIYYNDEDWSLAEAERFSLNHLEDWSLKNQLLESDIPISSFVDKEKKLGKLPLKNMSDYWVEKVGQSIAETKEWFRQETAGMSPTVWKGSFELDEGAMDIRISGIYGTKVIQINFSKSQERYRFEAYLTYLVIRSLNLPFSLVFRADQNAETFRFGPSLLIQETAKQRLNALVALFRKGVEEPLPFDFKMVSKIKNIDKIDPIKFAKSVDTEFINSFSMPCNDPYLITVFENGLFEAEGAFEQYKELYQLLVEDTDAFFKEGKVDEEIIGV